MTLDERKAGAAHVASRRRMAVGYVALLGAVAVVVAWSFAAGAGRRPAPFVAGVYAVERGTPCLGSEVRLVQSGRFVNVEPEASTAVAGKLRFTGRALAGSVTCADGESFPARLTVVPGTGLEGTVAGNPVELRFVRSLPPPETAHAEEPEEGGIATEAADRPVTAPAEDGGAEGAPALAPPPSAEETFGRLMLAIAVVVLAGRALGSVVSRIGQPRVMGEVLAGILLGPTLLGALAPSAQAALFPPEVVPLLSAGADIGLAFYMFLVGLELDLRMLRGRFEQAAFISHGSIAVPMALGIAAAVPVYTLVGPPRDFIPFALFMGVSMSITAFPVLARILVERRMLKRPVGAMAMGAAAVDDVTAWALLALASGVATATAGAGGAGQVGIGLLRIIGLAIVFCLVMAFPARRLLARVADAYDEAGHVPGGWIVAIFVGVLLSAYLTSAIPIAAIFGAFVMGLVMPRRADLTHDVSRRLEDFVTTVLLPLFFVTTGLKVRVGLLDRPLLWAVTGGLIVVAIVCKWGGAMLAARYTGMRWRESAVIGALMNTRGLTELIVLNLGLGLGLITPTLFAMLVLMALVTTFMAGPALRLIDRRGEFSAPADEELERAQAPLPARPERAVLVAPQDERNLDALLAVAEPLARSEPPREVIVAALLDPPRAATSAVRATDRALAEATAELVARRDHLLATGVAARAVAFTSAERGADLLRLAGEEGVDLVLVDGRRPLLGEGVPGGEVGTVLNEAPGDVAVLVERGGQPPVIGPAHPVVVPFGGADHDWAALELAAWLATDRGAPLRLLGIEADRAAGERDASRLLGNASLVVQQLAGVPAEPVLIPPGREGILEAARGAGLLVVGLSERWRQEGLGPLRSEIGRHAVAPVLFVRRGQRPGALAPRDDVTRFTWSRVGPAR
ncbi:MAG TPA: cation:proton antiporter [Actinomycetota bacterium]|nr:cation:proton antiporter [Actinomycetota bacterium]